MIRKRLGLALAFLLLPAVARAITPGQIDTFEDGTPMAWEEGPVSPDPPFNVATGGPAGAGDHFLRDNSNGEFASPGGKLTMYNVTQWTGDYVAAGVTALTVDLANFGPTPLYIRVALQGTSGQYCSTTPFVLPADGQWRTATFGLNAAELTAVALNVPLATFLTNITMLRVLSAQGAPTFHGDEMVGALGLDNLRTNAASAVGEAGPVDAAALRGAPNPFVGATRLHYVLPRAGVVALDIFDVTGRAVRHIEPRAAQAAGPHDLPWDGRDAAGAPVAPGVYFARIVADGYHATTKLQITR